jgi:UDP-glucuronate 4-epimerase
MAILVTGGAGFVGSHLVERLLADGQGVVCLDNLDEYYSPALKERNLARALKHPRFTLVRGDVRRLPDVERAFGVERLEAVAHLAGRGGVRPSVQDPLLYLDINVAGTIQILEACRRHAIGRLVLASSSSVYGGRTTVPFRESDMVDRPISPYAASKKAAELICHTYSHLYGLSVGCLRFFTAYGPRQRPDMAIAKFARAILEGREITLYGDGTSRRDYTYIEDIVAGIVGALRAPYGYEIFNLGNSETVTLDSLIAVLERVLGRPAQRRYEAEQPGDVPVTCADVTKARAMLGYDPRVSIEEGLARFAAWLREVGETGDGRPETGDGGRATDAARRGTEGGPMAAGSAGDSAQVSGLLSVSPAP